MRGATAGCGGAADSRARAFCSLAFASSRAICCWFAFNSAMLALSASISCPTLARSRAVDGAGSAGCTELTAGCASTLAGADWVAAAVWPSSLAAGSAEGELEGETSPSFSSGSEVVIAALGSHFQASFLKA